MIKQGTPEWHKERLGLFTSSHLSDLMVKGKNSEFGDTAMSYIYKVAAERTLADEFLSGAGFEMYLERMDMTSKSIRWGEDSEEMAREKLSELLGLTVNEAEFIKVTDYFGGSSDGWFENDAQIIPIEINAPRQAFLNSTQKLNQPNNCIRSAKPIIINVSVT